MQKLRTAYWLTTGLFCLMLGFSGTAHSLHLEPIASSMSAMGYPPFLMTILGFFKLLGVVALLVPGMSILKEWAYAGFAFNLLGAAASHVFAGDEFSHTIRPVIVLAIGAASYLLRPRERRPTESFSLGQADLDEASVAANAGEL